MFLWAHALVDLPCMPGCPWSRRKANISGNLRLGEEPYVIPSLGRDRCLRNRTAKLELRKPIGPGRHLAYVLKKGALIIRIGFREGDLRRSITDSSDTCVKQTQATVPERLHNNST